jgi:hypothetical protein
MEYDSERAEKERETEMNIYFALRGAIAGGIAYIFLVRYWDNEK